MINEISILMAFTAGLISFLSPCVLPLIPGYISFISGVPLSDVKRPDAKAAFLDRDHRGILLYSVFFIFGFTAIFIILGATATWIGSLISGKLGFFTKLAGLIIIFFGLIKLGLVRSLLFLKEFRIPFQNIRVGYVGSMILGAAFAFGWTPCVGPVLGGILTFAGTLDQVNQGIWLLLVYSAGLGVPFFLTALGIHRFFKLFNRIKKHLGLIEKITGLVLVAMGVLIFTNALSRLPAYLPFLNQFAL
jgi:cytochrome c-type biogenesis protein